MLIPLVIQVLIQWAQAMGASNSISSEYNIKTSREISAPFYTGTSNRKPVFYNIQEHTGIQGILYGISISKLNAMISPKS